MPGKRAAGTNSRSTLMMIIIKRVIRTMMTFNSSKNLDFETKNSPPIARDRAHQPLRVPCQNPSSISRHKKLQESPFTMPVSNLVKVCKTPCCLHYNSDFGLGFHWVVISSNSKGVNCVHCPVRIHSVRLHI